MATTSDSNEALFDFGQDRANDFFRRIAREAAQLGEGEDDKTEGDEPSVPAGEDFKQALISFMNQPLQTPKEQVESGRAPSPVNVSLTPPQSVISTSEQLQKMCRALDGVISLSELYAGIFDVTENDGKTLKISDVKEARKAFAQTADYAYKAMTKPLKGILSIGEEKVQTYTTSKVSAELHLGFLGKIFDGFNLGEDAISQLDLILKNVAEAIGKVQVTSESEESTVDHFLRVTSIKCNNLGTKERPVMEYEPFVTIFYIKIRQKSWKSAMSKWQGGGSVEKADFDMTFTSVACKLNMDVYEANKTRCDGMISLIIGQNLETYGPKIVQKIEIPL